MQRLTVQFLRLLISIITIQFCMRLVKTSHVTVYPKSVFINVHKAINHCQKQKANTWLLQRLQKNGFLVQYMLETLNEQICDNEAFGSSRSFLVYLKTSLYFSYIVLTLKQKSLREWSIPFSDLQFGEIVGVSPKGYVYK